MGEAQGVEILLVEPSSTAAGGPRCSVRLKPVHRSHPCCLKGIRHFGFQNKAAFEIFHLSFLFFVSHKERHRQNNADKAGYL